MKELIGLRRHTRSVGGTIPWAVSEQDEKGKGSRAPEFIALSFPAVAAM